MQQDEQEQLAALVREIEGLREHALEAERLHACVVEAARPNLRPSARNLLHYLALRSVDLRPLQAALAPSPEGVERDRHPRAWNSVWQASRVVHAAPASWQSEKASANGSAQVRSAGCGAGAGGERRCG